MALARPRSSRFGVVSGCLLALVIGLVSLAAGCGEYPRNTETTSSGEFSTFSSSTYGFSLRYPTNKFLVEADEDAQFVPPELRWQAALQVPGSSALPVWDAPNLIDIMVRREPHPRRALTEWIGLLRDDDTRTVTEVEFAGIPAFRVTSPLLDGESSVTWYYFVHGKSSFSVAVSEQKGIPPGSRKDLDAVLQSFRFIRGPQ